MCVNDGKQTDLMSEPYTSLDSFLASPGSDNDIVLAVDTVTFVLTTPARWISVNADPIEVSPASSPYSSSV